MLDKHKERIENARVGYEVANNLWSMANQNYWEVYNALLVANSILLASIGWIFSKDGDRFLAYLSFVIIPIVGIAICTIWFFISHRSSVYYRYYLFSARELEEKYLSDPVKTLSRGGKLLKGEPVDFLFRGDEKKTEKIWILPETNTTWYSYFIIGLFALIYLIVFFYGLFRISGCTLYTFQFQRSNEMDLYVKIVWTVFCGLSLLLGIGMIKLSICGLKKIDNGKTDNELKSRNFKFIAFLGTTLIIVALLLTLLILK